MFLFGDLLAGGSVVTGQGMSPNENTHDSMHLIGLKIPMSSKLEVCLFVTFLKQPNNQQFDQCSKQISKARSTV